jgi:hypothetical protein
VINLSDVPLEDATYTALWKGQNYVVASVVLPIEDFFSGVEKAVGFLPKKEAEKERQETACRELKENLFGAEKKALGALWTNAYLTVLRADKGNAAVVLNTSDYNRNIADLCGPLLIGDCPGIPLTSDSRGGRPTAVATGFEAS